jgi:hypothetical protein
MSSKNDITGDSIQTKVASNAYRNNFDVIFRKPTPLKQENDNESKEICSPPILDVLPSK